MGTRPKGDLNVAAPPEDPAELLAWLRKRSIEPALWHGTKDLKEPRWAVKLDGPTRSKTPRIVAAVDAVHDALAQLLLAELAEERDGDDHCWLLRRGDPPLLACGSRAWVERCLRTACTFAGEREWSRWTCPSDSQVGKISTVGKSDSLCAPRLALSSEVAPAGPAGALALVLDACPACVFRVSE